jgi:Polyketide cyclase / dehydrase and lipid transport
MEINAAAPVITRDEIVIDAPIETIWEIQTDVPGWPAWQPEVDGAQADGPLAAGSVFSWQTAGLDIVAVHAWTLTERDVGVLVHTEESWEGEPVIAQIEALQAALDASLRAWLENLKRTAEAGA